MTIFYFFIFLATCYDLYKILNINQYARFNRVMTNLFKTRRKQKRILPKIVTKSVLIFSLKNTFIDLPYLLLVVIGMWLPINMIIFEIVCVLNISNSILPSKLVLAKGYVLIESIICFVLLWFAIINIYYFGIIF